MFRDFFTLQYNNGKTVLLFFLLLFQMLGLRLFQGWGVILTLIIFFILVFSIRITSNRIITSFGLGLVAMLFQAFKGSSASYCILVAFYIIDACFMIYYTKDKDVLQDFKASLHIYLIQAFLSIVIYIIVPKSLMWIPQTGGVHNLTFLYIFYYVPRTFLGIPQLSGWAWEPGCMQMLINLYICFQVLDGSKIKQLIIPSILLFLTASSAGYLIYALIICTYIFKIGIRKVFSYTPILILFSIFIFPLMWANFADKLSIGSDSGINTSGAMRVRDFLVGVEEVKCYPLFGINMSDLSNSKEYQKLEDTALSKMTYIDNTWRNYFDYAEGGYNNGFFCMHMLWGLMGIAILFWFIKCDLWKQWYPRKFHYLIPGVILLTLVSSPLSNTALFLYFSLYNVISKK